MPHYNELKEMEERNRRARTRTDDLPLFRQEGPSVTRAESLRSTDCSREARRVYDWMRAQGAPVHLHLICQALRKTPNQVSPRLGELERAGMIAPTGEKVWWHPTGRNVALWEVRSLKCARHEPGEDKVRSLKEDGRGAAL